MYLADMHVHTIYSYDGQMSMEGAVLKAIELGLKYIAFTEHLEFSQINMKQFLNRYRIYLSELKKLQEKYPNIKLISGVEFSNPELYPKELEQINKLNIDYIIGSNHILPSNNEREILEYYKRILQMVKNGGIDTLGHLDYLRRKVDDGCISKDIIKEICSYLLKNNITLEINSSALRRTGLYSFPSEDKLKIYKELGGKNVTIGSDAHRLYEIYDSINTLDKIYSFNKGIYLKRKFISIKE